MPAALLVLDRQHGLYLPERDWTEDQPAGAGMHELRPSLHRQRTHLGLNDDDAQPFFCQAVEVGVTFWDTANTYQVGISEEIIRLATGPRA
jgi:hypothetical protein